MKPHILLILSILFCGCSTIGTTSKENGGAKEYTLATYNVGAFRKYDDSSIASIAESVKSLGCDIISLNELDSCTRRTSNVNQLKEFAQALGGWNYSFGKAISYQGGSYGIGVASRPGLGMLTIFDIPLERGEGKEDRDVKVVETKDFVFASTHLDYVIGESQLAQARKATETLISRYGSASKPVFLCGDMNSYPDSDVLEYFRKYWKVLSPEGITFPYAAGDSRGDGVCIDYIMILNNGVEAEVVDSRIVSDNKLSDHYPVVVKVKF